MSIPCVISIAWAGESSVLKSKVGVWNEILVPIIILGWHQERYPVITLKF